MDKVVMNILQGSVVTQTMFHYYFIMLSGLHILYPSFANFL